MPSPPKLLAALGDSLTAGHVPSGWSVEYAPYTEVLRERLGERIRLENFGLDGDLTGNMVVRYERSVVPLEPDMLLLLGGANDLGWGISLEDILTNLTNIVAMARGAGAEVLVGAVPPIQAFEDLTRLRVELNDRLRAMCDEQGAVYVDLFAPLADDSGFLLGEYSADGLHLTEGGYRLMGERFCYAVADLLDAGLEAAERGG